MKSYVTARLTIIMLIVLAWVTTAAMPAPASDALLNKLVEKGILSQEEADEVRAELTEEQAATAALYQKTAVSSWIEQLKWSGDLRLRTEYFDSNDDSSDFDADRWRFRVRLRLGVDWQIRDWVSVHVRLASGGEDPTSTNQTLGDTFSSKPIWIDRAYVEIQPPGWEWFTVRAGKIKNPTWQPGFGAPMQYDGDVNPEGVAEMLRFSLDDEKRHTLFANFGQYVIDEFKTDSQDPFLFDFQGGIKSAWGGEDAKNAPVNTSLAAGYMITHNLVNRNGSTYTPRQDSGNRGNAATGEGAGATYQGEFKVVNIRGDVAWQVSDEEFLGTPLLLTLSGEYITNLDSSYESQALTDPDQTDGYTFQLKFGKAKKKGTWQVLYQYRYLEADATFDAITDSDWGFGGTDRKGHLVKAAYQLQDWWQLGAAAFLTDKISSRPNSGHNTRDGAEHDLLRIQLDSVFKF